MTNAGNWHMGRAEATNAKRFHQETDMSKRTVEIRAAEGGEDARLFVAELAHAYLRLAASYG